MNARHVALFLFATLMLASIAGSGKAADPAYPTRQVELICSATPGGGNDTATRAMAEFVARRWASPVVVVNKPGGGT